MDAALNWIWQGGAIALTVSVVLRLLRCARARDRFVLCGAALLTVLALPILPVLVAAVSPADHQIHTTAAPMLALPGAWWTSSTVLIVALVPWITVQGFRMASALIAVRRIRRQCAPFPEVLEARLPRWNAVRGTGRRARLALTGGVRSAAVLGCGSPLVALAPALVGRLTPKELDRVILHEWAHVQRRDDVVALAQLAVRIVAGWHPAVWWLGRQMEIEREAACDETVVELAGSRKGYAASLATIASLPRAGLQELAAIGMMSVGRLETRVVRILSSRQLASRRWSGVASAGALLVVAALSPAIASLPLVGAATAARSAAPQAALRAMAPAGPNGVAGGPAAAADVLPVASRPARPEGAQAEARRPVLPGRGVADRVLTAPPALIQATGVEVTPAAATPAAPLPGPVHGTLAGDEVAAAWPPQEPDRVDPAAAPPSTSPWKAATGAGTKVGRDSRQAAITTAGFFTRFGKKLAASF